VGLTFDWPKLRHEELCVGRGTGGGGGGGTRAEERAKREADRGKASQMRRGLYCTARNVLYSCCSVKLIGVFLVASVPFNFGVLVLEVERCWMWWVVLSYKQ